MPNCYMLSRKLSRCLHITCHTCKVRVAKKNIFCVSCQEKKEIYHEIILCYAQKLSQRSEKVPCTRVVKKNLILSCHTCNIEVARK